MKPTHELIRQLPDLDSFAKRLKQDPHATASQLFRPQKLSASRSDQPESAVGLESMELVESRDFADLEIDELSEITSRAVNKVRTAGNDADLDQSEQSALEAIILLVGRPPLFIQNGRLQSDLGDEWKHLDAKRTAMEATFASVGRIEVTGHSSLDWIGTGFLVADDVIMTNRHVAREFSEKVRARWKFQFGMSARIDYVEEFGALTSAEFALTKVIGVHDVFDLALFRVEQTSAQAATAPQGLPVAAQPPSSLVDHEVFAVGYPAWDGRRNDPAEMQRIFQNRFDVKRCQPGKITRAPNDSVFVHDCSTLGGNSGSCVIDLETFRVIGLHFGGRYLKGNVAVALWELTNDPLLQKAKLNWV